MFPINFIKLDKEIPNEKRQFVSSSSGRNVKRTVQLFNKYC